MHGDERVSGTVILLLLHTALLLAILTGIAYRRRWRATLAFPLYLAIGTAHNLAQSTVTMPAGDWLAWLLVVIAQRIVALVVAVEVGAVIFHRQLAGGRAVTGRAMLAILFVGLIAAATWGRQLGAAVDDHALYFALVEGARRLAALSAAVFSIVIALAVSHYGWPVEPYHRDVACGLWLYHLAFMLAAPWTHVSPLAKHWPVWLYGAILLWWVCAAWRRPNLTSIAPEFRSLAWPWLEGAR